MEYMFFFFYGPLAEGGFNHSTIPLGSRKVRDLTLPFKLYQTPYGTPAMTQEKGSTKGEIYRVPRAGLVQLDRFYNYNSPNDPNNQYIRKKIKIGEIESYLYFAGKELEELCHMYNISIVDGDWLKFYNTTWKQYDTPEDYELSGNFTEKELMEVCKEFGVDTIQEVNMLLESAYRREMMLEAMDKNKKNNSEPEASLDDLTEPEEEEKEPSELPVGVDVASDNELGDEVWGEPTLSDLDAPEGEDEEVEEKPTSEEKPKDNGPKPTAPEIPSSKELPSEEKKEEQKTSFEWKKEKHLRTLYNNFFKVYPKRGSSTEVHSEFNSVKANALHPDSKYLQANITSMCTSEDPEKVGEYYTQWIQLRRQRNTQEWSVDLPCEVRCNCKTFIYKLAYANIRNKSFAGSVVTKGTKDGYPINYRIPSNETNPNYTPALCKHLMGLTNKVFDVKGTGGVRKDLVV